MFKFELIQQPLPVRTEGKQKNIKKTSRRILEVTAKVSGAHWERERKI
jgi:hypothetical protein